MFSLLRYNNFLELIKLCVDERQQIVEMFQRGKNQSKISRALNISSKTARKIWVKFQQTGSVSNKKRSGRPKKYQKGGHGANSHFQEGPA